MAEMVRKQIYVHKRHERLLKQLSQARRVSEAEIIRQALEREATGEKGLPSSPDHGAWEEILGFVKARKASSTRDRPYRWNRQDAYLAREKRINRRHARR